jgi:hypothetical protein
VEKNSSQKRAGGMAGGVGLELKSQYHKTNKQKTYPSTQQLQKCMPKGPGKLYRAIHCSFVLGTKHWNHQSLLE